MTKVVANVPEKSPLGVIVVSSRLEWGNSVFVVFRDHLLVFTAASSRGRIISVLVAEKYLEIQGMMLEGKGTNLVVVVGLEFDFEIWERAARPTGHGVVVVYVRERMGEKGVITPLKIIISKSL